MKKTIAILMVLAFISIMTSVTNADVYVRGYRRSNGTYVQPHYRSNPDGIRSNNWSTRGNINPHTGKRGTKSLSSMYGQLIDGPSTLPYSPDQHPFKGKIGPIPSPLPLPTNHFPGAKLLSN